MEALDRSEMVDTAEDPGSVAEFVALVNATVGKHFKCCICLSLFNDPVMLPCNHSMCRECAAQALKQNQRCPECLNTITNLRTLQGRSAWISDMVDSLRNCLNEVGASLTQHAPVPHMYRNARPQSPRARAKARAAARGRVSPPSSPSPVCCGRGREEKSKGKGKGKAPERKRSPPAQPAPRHAAPRPPAHVREKIKEDGAGVVTWPTSPRTHKRGSGNDLLWGFAASQPEEEGDDKRQHKQGKAGDATGGNAIARSRPFVVGDLVFVDHRTWPGMNKHGGVALVQAVSDPPGSFYDVKYSVGHRVDRDVDARYVHEYSFPPNVVGGRSSRRSSSRGKSSASGGSVPPSRKRSYAGGHPAAAAVTASAVGLPAPRSRRKMEPTMPGTEEQRTSDGMEEVEEIRADGIRGDCHLGRLEDRLDHIAADRCDSKETLSEAQAKAGDVDNADRQYHAFAGDDDMTEIERARSGRMQNSAEGASARHAHAGAGEVERHEPEVGTVVSITESATARNPASEVEAESRPTRAVCRCPMMTIAYEERSCSLAPSATPSDAQSAERVQVGSLEAPIDSEEGDIDTLGDLMEDDSATQALPPQPAPPPAPDLSVASRRIKNGSGSGGANTKDLNHNPNATGSTTDCNRTVAGRPGSPTTTTHGDGDAPAATSSAPKSANCKPSHLTVATHAGHTISSQPLPIQSTPLPPTPAPSLAIFLPTPPPQRPLASGAPNYEVGDLVNVQCQSSPGLNKEGGVARVTRVCPNGTYDVKYCVRSGTDKALRAALLTRYDVDGDADDASGSKSPHNGGGGGDRRRNDAPGTAIAPAEDRPARRLQRTTKGYCPPDAAAGQANAACLNMMLGDTQHPELVLDCDWGEELDPTEGIPEERRRKAATGTGATSRAESNIEGGPSGARAPINLVGHEQGRGGTKRARGGGKGRDGGRHELEATIGVGRQDAGDDLDGRDAYVVGGALQGSIGGEAASGGLENGPTKQTGGGRSKMGAQPGNDDGSTLKRPQRPRSRSKSPRSAATRRAPQGERRGSGQGIFAAKRRGRGGGVVLTMSAVTPEMAALAKSLAKSQSWMVEAKYNEEVTHVVCRTASDTNKANIRSAKFLRAVAAGKWVVNEAWLQAYKAQGAQVKEENFEIAGDKKSGVPFAPRRSRLAHADPGRPGLFQNSAFYFRGEFGTESPPRSELEPMLLANGGIVAQTLELLCNWHGSSGGHDKDRGDSRRRRIVLFQASASYPQEDVRALATELAALEEVSVLPGPEGGSTRRISGREEWGVEVMRPLWLVDCVGSFRMLNPTDLHRVSLPRVTHPPTIDH